MIACMKFWITNTGIDGFRCDVAGEVPDAFWSRCIPELKSIKNIFMLGEGDKPSLNRSGFDATYPWDMFVMMKKVASGERPAFALDSTRLSNDTAYPANALRMYFTSNHDENSWNKADFATMPGAVHAPFAVLTQTMVRGVPLIYSGQEEPVLRAIEFFEKDPMEFKRYLRAPFYRTLLNLRSRNIALSADASFRKVNAGDSSAVYAFVREKAGKRVLVILNLSAKTQQINVQDRSLAGTALNVFMSTPESIGAKTWSMEPWGYAVYEYANISTMTKANNNAGGKPGKMKMKVKSKSKK
jgi:glycosidase